MKSKSFFIFTFMIGLMQTTFTQSKMTGGIEVGNTPIGVNSTMALCDTVFSFLLRGEWAGGMTFDGNYLYSTDNYLPYIYKYNLNGQLMDSIPSPSVNAGGLANGDLDFDGTYLWVVVEDDGKLYKLDPLNGNVLLSYPLPSNSPNDPNNFGCAYDNGYVWTSEYLDKALIRIDASTGAVANYFSINRRIFSIELINNELYGMGFDGSLEGTLFHFDKNTGGVLDSTAWCLKYPVGFCMENQQLWGLSSSQSFGGTQRIYKFNNFPVGVSVFNESQNKGIEILPNPSSGDLTIQIKGKLWQKSVEIYNGLGEQIDYETLSNNQIHINAPNGVYFIKANDGKNVFTEKFMIKL